MLRNSHYNSWCCSGSGTKDEDVVHIDGHYSSCDEFFENVVIIVWNVAGLFVRPKNMTEV